MGLFVALTHPIYKPMAGSSYEFIYLPVLKCHRFHSPHFPRPFGLSRETILADLLFVFFSENPWLQAQYDRKIPQKISLRLESRPCQNDSSNCT